MLRVSAALLLAPTAGCHVGTPTSQRELTVLQTESVRDSDRYFEIDTSQMPPGSFKARTDRNAAGRGPRTVVKLKFERPVRIIIVPATQTAAASND